LFLHDASQIADFARCPALGFVFFNREAGGEGMGQNGAMADRDRQHRQAVLRQRLARLALGTSSREDPHFLDTPTGNPGDSSRAEALLERMMCYLCKPFAEDKLLA
jgi:hypothetical protein